MEKPLVSVIIATYNREKYIGQAIKSVLNQTYKNREVIIVDDSSTSKTQDIVSEIDQRDTRIVHIKNKNRIGFVKSLNKGIRMAEGKYIARLDDDDFWCDPQKLEKQVRFLEEHPDYVLVGGGAIVLDEEGKECFRVLLPETDEEIRRLMLFDCLFPHSTVVFRRDIWKIVGGYNGREGIKGVGSSEDWDLWLRFGEFGKFYNFQEYFLYYLQGKQNDRPRYIIQQNFRFNLKLRKKYRNLYPNFWKAYLFGLASYFYSFFPFQKWLRPVMPKLKNMFLHYQIYQKTQKDDKRERN